MTWQDTVAGDVGQAQAGRGELEPTWRDDATLLLHGGKAVLAGHRTAFDTEVVSVRAGLMQWERASYPGVRR